MSQQETIKLFETQKVRTYWDNEKEEWYFCINDVIKILTDSVDPADYFKKLRKRDPELDAFVRGTSCPPHQFISTDGKLHAQKCLTTKDTLRLIQSIPSKKAEPFKMWLAQVGSDRLTEMADPEKEEKYLVLPEKI